MFDKSLDERPRSFWSHRCGYTFIKYRSALVEKCPKCGEPCFDRNLETPFPFTRRSEAEMLRLLDHYSYKKYLWYKHPGFHEEDIRTRIAKNEPTLT